MAVTELRALLDPGEGAGECYISYDDAPAQWTRADGSRPPARKPFESPTYDAATRTFRGTIDWGDNPFGGAARWEYEMVFSEDFSAITGGQVDSFGIDGSQDAPIPFCTAQWTVPGLSYKRLSSGFEELYMLLTAGLPE